jgi:EAL domain-containing protein (putative c-di-GMP-specific phosphodiesterase class I)
VIHPELGSGVNLDGLRSQILNTLAQPFKIGSETIRISTGIGIALYPDDSVSPLELPQMASFALRSAKTRGAGQLSYFRPDMQEEAAERLQLIEDMRQALAAKEFQVCYQPIVNLADNTVVKAEALTRWNHAVRGAVSPGVFIPSAERSGLISQLGEFVTAQSVEFTHQMRQQAPEFQVSFNMSPMELSEAGTSHASRIDLISNSGLPGSAFVIEITEGLLLNADAIVRANLDAYHEAGFSFAIDDFGTGYSSLSYLQSLDVDWIKIDQSFVRRLGIDSNSFVLVQAMIVMAHQLGLQVIAEGVETEKQRDLLKEAQCDFAQGFLFSPALPPHEFSHWRETWSASIQ